MCSLRLCGYLILGVTLKGKPSYANQPFENLVTWIVFLLECGGESFFAATRLMSLVRMVSEWLTCFWNVLPSLWQAYLEADEETRLLLEDPTRISGLGFDWCFICIAARHSWAKTEMRAIEASTGPPRSTGNLRRGRRSCKKHTGAAVGHEIEIKGRPCPSFWELALLDASLRPLISVHKNSAPDCFANRRKIMETHVNGSAVLMEARPRCPVLRPVKQRWSRPRFVH